MTIIYHESFLSVSEKDVFENQLSMEIRLTLAPNGTVLDCNKNGKILVDRFGRSFLNFFPDESVGEAEDYLKSILDSEEVVAALLHDRTRDNGVGTLYNGFSKNGTIFLAGFQTTLLTHLAAEFVHELRNPLAVIKGFVQLSALTQDFYKYQGTILSEIDRMHSLLDSFLKLSKKNIMMQKIPPDKLCSSMIALISSECTMRKVDLDYDVAFSENACNADISMIKQVVLNITRNALEALDGKGEHERHIFFRGSVEDKGYRFAISDNGPGMETCILKKIGQPFFTTKENGTGIGLSLSKKIVAEHHGSFCVSSAVGRGTTISFLLPFVSDS
ncbi:sensor histidine kinase [Sporolactobacillus shoreae]|nr:HAMP domain-containing sensor histidine kinase [Sporolactobacillus shoreae]